jgi:hypothetical protein
MPRTEDRSGNQIAELETSLKAEREVVRQAWLALGVEDAAEAHGFTLAEMAANWRRRALTAEARAFSDERQQQ